MGRAALGLHWVRLDDGPAEDLVGELRRSFVTAVLDHPAGLELARDGRLDPGAATLVRRVKERFDPKGTLV